MRVPAGGWLGALVIGALAWHAVTKLPDHLGEMLWVCHVASLVLAVGLIAGRQPLVAAGLLLHLAWGAPAYLLDAIATRSTTVTSALVHVLPIVTGMVAVRARGWPRGIAVRAWIFFALWIPVSYVATDPALNVNLAHAPWPPLARLLPGVWSGWAFNLGSSLLLFLLVDRALRRLFPPPARQAPASRDPLPVLGALAFLFFAIHCAEHLRRGEVADLLWLSNLATLLLAVGCALRNARAVGLAALWLGLSALLWMLDVIFAGSRVDSAILTHLGSFGIAILAVRALAVPRRTWLAATGGLALLVGVCRMTTAPERNVNLAFVVPPGWAARFGSHGVYLAMLLVLAAALFLALELAFERAIEKRTSVLDYGTIPVLLAGMVIATRALLDLAVPPMLASGLVVGAVAAVVAILERVRPERDDQRAFDQPLRVEIAHFIFNYNLGYALALAACVPIGRAAAALFPVAPWPSGWPLALQIALAAVLSEGVSYWQHRLSHRNRWLWKFHALHHSGGRLNLARTARFHLVDIAPGAFLVFLPLVVLRAPESIIGWAGTIAGTFGVLTHANLRLRTPAWLNRLVCTPAVHRFHHSSNGPESNANFGTLVMLFDHLFGSYRLPTGPGPAAVGIQNDPVPRGRFWPQMLAPFRRLNGPQASPPR